MKATETITKALRLCTASLAIAAAGSARAAAQWDAGGSDNYWATEANWVGDTAPTYNDGANFDFWDLTGSQTIELSADASAAGMYIWSYGDRANYQFVGNGHTLTLSNTAQLADGSINFNNLNVTFSSAELRLAGDRAKDVAFLTQNGGTVALHGWTYIGSGWNNEYSYCKGVYTLDGNGAFGGNDDFHIAWGESCTGIVNVVSGSVTCGYRTMLGEGPNSIASLTVGNNGSWTQTDDSSTFRMANGDNATADASISGYFSVKSGMYLGEGVNSKATFTVNNGANVVIGGETTIGVGENSKGELNLLGGRFTTKSMIDSSGSGTVTLDGGTLVASAAGTLIGSGIAVTVGTNGGTIDVGANNVTIAATVTGTGTITKKGTGTLTFTGDMSGFTGTIQVKDGSVVVPSASSSIAAGPSTLKTVADNTTVFTSVSATAFEFDFEDSSMSGWTAKEYNAGAKGSSSIASRNLVVANKNGEMSSKFYRYQSFDGGSGDRGAYITYNLSADTSALSDYTLEMDWFAVQNGKYEQQSSHDVGLTLSSASGAVVAVLANPDSAVTGNNAGVYLNGATAASGTIPTAAPYGDCSGDTNQGYWYHAILRASETDGVSFSILKNDGTVAFSETRVCDYIKITQIKLDAHRVRVSNTSKGGIDDVIITVPAKASFDGIGYKTLQEAVNVAATSSETTKIVTLLDNVTEDITLSTPGSMVSLGVFAISGTVSAGAGMVVNYDDVTKTWTCEADISTYTWTNTTGNNLWNDPENWMAGNSIATVAPTADTTVVFPSAANVSAIELTEKGYAKQIQANGDVVFTGALVALNDSTENGVVGSGKITLGNNSGFEVTTGTLTIVNPVEITATVANQAQIEMNDYENLYLKGNLTGSGSIRLGADRSRIYLSGNNTGFTGSFITVASPNDRSHVVFANAQATSSSAAWTINSGIEKTGTSWNIVESYGQTYTFGELKGKFHNDTAAGRSTSKFEVGALNTDFAFTYYGVNNSSNDRYDSFRKVGSGKMEITGTYVRHYELVDGTVKLMTDASLPVRDTADAGIRFEGGALQLAEAFTVDPSPKFVFIANKTAIFDDEGITRTFATAIGNSVAANFVKKGTGSLTLSTPPTYTGTTTVEEGVLYVIDGDYTLTLAAGTAQVPSNKDGYKMYVPGTVAAGGSMNVVAGSKADAEEMATVTLTPEQVADGVQSDYYKVVAESTGTPGEYKLEVKFADEVTEVVSETVSETVSGTKVTFQMNFKKGLYYGLSVGATAEAVETAPAAADMAKCTDAATGVDLSADIPGENENVKYYRVFVTDANE